MTLIPGPRYVPLILRDDSNDQPRILRGRCYEGGGGEHSALSEDVPHGVVDYGVADCEGATVGKEDEDGDDSEFHSSDD